MKIGIIGAGFTGLSAAYRLAKEGHEVVVIERDPAPGGLAVGFKNTKWNWTAEKHYHHFFANDYSVINLAKEINYRLETKRPKTSIYLDGDFFQMDTPLNVLTFPKLTLPERLRMAAVLGFLKFNSVWKPLEKYRTADALAKLMGETAYRLIWEPQLLGKFEHYADKINLAWFWARIKKRTPNLLYPEGGFLSFAKALESKIIGYAGVFHYEAEAVKIKGGKHPTVEFKTTGKKTSVSEEFDAVIVTLPSLLFLRLADNLPEEYEQRLSKLEEIGAINLVLRLREPFFKNKTYWLSVCERSFPFVAVVEHTNFMDKKNYNDEHIVYVGKYAAYNHPFFSKSKDELFNLYDEYLEKLSPEYKKTIIDFEVFKAPFAQPIIPVDYSKIVPPFKTPLEGVFLANIQQVYPWDRGTNYAVELGGKIAELISS